MTTRKLPRMLDDARTLPNGEYLVRVVHLHERDTTHSAGRTVEALERHAEWMHDNVPNVVLYLGARTFVLDTAQSFQFGTRSQAEPPKLLSYYKLTVYEPGKLDSSRNAWRGVDVRYEELGTTEPQGFGELTEA